MGSAAAKEREVAQSRSLQEWQARLRRYFERYNLAPNPARMQVLVGRVAQDRSVWLALLAKYGPELDPPFDQPPNARTDDIGVRRRKVHLTQTSGFRTKEEWTARLVKYFEKYRPELSEERIRDFVHGKKLDEMPVAWEVFVAEYGPEPIGDVVSTKDERRSMSDRKSIRSLDGRSKRDVVDRCRFKVQSLKVLRGRNISVTLGEMEALLDSFDGNLANAAAAVQERAIQGRGVKGQRGELSRAEWEAVLTELAPELDVFEMSTLMEDYESRPGQLDELFKVMSETVVKPKVLSRTTQLQPTDFWVRRIAELHLANGKPLSIDDEDQLRGRIASNGFQHEWAAALNAFGGEPQRLEEMWRSQREYWVFEAFTLLEAAFPHRTINLDVARTLLAHATQQEQWRGVVEQLAADNAELEVAGSSELRQAVRGVRNAENMTATDEASWLLRLSAFYATYDKAKVDQVPDILTKAMAHPGGVQRMWELLQLKYSDAILQRTALSIAADASIDRSAPDEAVRSPRRPLPAVGDAVLSVAPPDDTAITPDATVAKGLDDDTGRRLERVVAAAVPPRAPALWTLRAHCLRLGAGIETSAGNIDNALKKYTTPSDGYQALEREYQEWFVPKMDDRFWTWRAERLASDLRRELPLRILPEPTHGEPGGAKSWYTRLREAERGDGLTAAGAFEEYTRAVESTFQRTRGWMQGTTTASDRPAICDRDFWEKNLLQLCQREHPSVGASQIQDAFDMGEVRGVPYEKVFVNFVQTVQREALLGAQSFS